MVLSEKEADDKLKLKNGLIGVVVLLVLGSVSPMIISEFTNVDVYTLCETDEDGNEVCPDEGELSSAVIDALGYVSLFIAIIGFIGLVIVGVKY